MELFRDQSKWSQETFGSDSERGPLGAIRHLAKEAVECEKAVGTPHLQEELADVLILFLDASRRAGYRPLEIVVSAIAKMEKNKQRTWPKPVDDMPVEHDRSKD